MLNLLYTNAQNSCVKNAERYSRYLTKYSVIILYVGVILMQTMKYILYLICILDIFIYKMGKRYAAPIVFTPKKFKYIEDVDSVLLDNFRLSKELVVNTIVTDINKRKWRIGKAIGKITTQCMNVIHAIRYSILKTKLTL